MMMIGIVVNIACVNAFCELMKQTTPRYNSYNIVTTAKKCVQ